jgi:acyl carrier protein
MQIEGLIREYMNENVLYGDSAIEYTDDTSFLAAGILDSMAVLELVSWVESTFNVKPDVRDITPENFDSVGRLAAFIRARTVNGHARTADAPVAAASIASK